MTMTVQMHIPSQDMKLLQELAAKMGWDISADGLDKLMERDARRYSGPFSLY